MPRTTDSPDSPTLPPIYPIRKQRVVLDRDLAKLYGVPTKRFNEAVGRNADRFPADFRFQLTREEVTNLKSQIATSSSGSASTRSTRHGGNRRLPWAFTEHGALMAANVLRSGRAVQMSIYLVRAFVRMREELLASVAVLRRLDKIDRKLIEHDVVLQDVVEKLLPLLDADDPHNDPPPKRRIGFL